MICGRGEKNEIPSNIIVKTENLLLNVNKFSKYIRYNRKNLWIK